MQTTAPFTQSPSPPLRAVREAHGLGLREVAALAAIDPAHLSRVERGQSALSVHALHRIARVLGLRELERLIAPYTRGRERG
jgi:transcriptional regulator with XRE-family HTH domain